MHKYGEVIGQWLAEAGVRINGPDLWDIRVRDDRFYARVLKDGSLGLGEAYMAGWWDCPRIDEFICRLLKGNLEDKIRGNLRTLLRYAPARLFNLQSPFRAGIIARNGITTWGTTFSSPFWIPATSTVAATLRTRTIWRRPVSYTHLRAHETRHDLVCRLLLEKKKKK